MREITFEEGILYVNGDRAREVTKSGNSLFFRVINKDVGWLSHYVIFKNLFIENPFPHPPGRCELSHQAAYNLLIANAHD